MDTLYEFDAPRFYDFKRDDDGASMASQWFDQNEEEGEEADSQMRSPLSELPRDVNKQNDNSLASQSNLVTSWAQQPATAGKSFAPTRPAGQENAGVVRAQPPITRSVTKAKQQAMTVEANPLTKPLPIKSQTKNESKLRVIAPIMKKQATVTSKPRLAHSNFKEMLQSKKVVPARSTKPLTLPDDGVDRLMSRASKRSKVKPDASASPFKSLAVKVQEFLKKTPGRFKRSSRSQPSSNKGPRPLTKPQAPVLMTDSRARSSNAVSSEQLEVDKLSKIPKFKATKVNPEVLLGSGSYGDRLALPPKQLTRPEPFNFVTDDRADRRRFHQPIDVEPVSAFKAVPLDRSILEGPVGVGFPARSTFTATVAKSPLLRSKLRSQDRRRSHQVMNLEEPEKKEFHARPIPQYLLVPCHEFKPVPLVKTTLPDPFSLRTEQRGRAYESSLRAKIAQDESKAKKARIPRAQLLPQSLEVPMIPPKPEPRGLTLPRPFNLCSEARHHEFQEELSHELRHEAEVKRSRIEFKALPLPRLDKVFHPHESSQPLTMPKDPRLATRSRAAERAEFDKAMEEKMRLEEMQRQADEEIKRAAEEDQVRAFRKAAVFKAKPLPDFSLVPMAMPCSKPLTVPESPHLGRGGKRARRV